MDEEEMNHSRHGQVDQYYGEGKGEEEGDGRSRKVEDSQPQTSNHIWQQHIAPEEKVGTHHVSIDQVH